MDVIPIIWRWFYIQFILDRNDPTYPILSLPLPPIMPTNGHVRVILIDDQPRVAERAATSPERRQASTTVATGTNPDDGLARLRDGPADCILSGVELDGMDGVEFLRRVRGAGFDDLTIILFTDTGYEARASHAVETGATDCLRTDGGEERDHGADPNREAVADERSRREEEEYRMLIDMMEEPVFVLDGVGVIERANEPLAELLEVDLPELLGTTASSFVAGGAERLAAAVEDRIEAGDEPITERVRIETAGERTLVGEITLRPQFDQSGEQVATIGLVRRTSPSSFSWDEGAEHEQVEKYETILRAVGDPVYAVDPEGRIVFVNEAYAEETPFSPDELIGMPVQELRDDDAIAQVEDAIRELWHSETRSKGTVELQREGRNGGTRYVENHIALLPPGEDGEFRRTAGVLRVITDRVERERTLEQYRSLVNAMTDPAAIYDREGRYQLVNAAIAEERFGDDPDDLVGRPSALVRAVREQADEDPYQELIDGEREEIRGQLEEEFDDGSDRVVDYRITRLVTDGECRGAVSVSRDISEQKAQERELRETRTVLRTVVEHLPVGILVEDEDRTIRLANGTLGDVLGVSLSADDLIGRESTTVIRELRELVEEPSEFYESFETRVESDKPHRHEEWELVDGRTIERDYLPYMLGDDPASMWIFREVTARKEREQELQRQNERLDEFASMVSHDLPNPLNVAKGRLELAMEEAESEHLEHVAKAHGRINALIEDLLALARAGSAEQEETVDLGDLSTSCWETVATEDGTLRVNAAHEVVADASRLRQLLENLFRNAVEHGGTAVTVSVGELADGFYVEDDGMWIPENEREDIFEPGFSTISNGTGLGLSIVKQVAEGHGWAITVGEGVGGGARFEIRDVDIV